MSIPHEAKTNILVIRLDAIGDMILSTPFLRELRRNYPESWITLVVRKEVVNLVELCPYVNKVESYGVVRGGVNTTATRISLFHTFYNLTLETIKSSVQRLNALTFSLRRLRRDFDYVILPRWSNEIPEAYLLAYYSGARLRVGFGEDEQSDSHTYKYLNVIFPRFDKENNHNHEVERSLYLLRHLGLSVANTDLEYWLDRTDTEFVNLLLKKTAMNSPNQLLIAFGIGAGSPNRRWPYKRFIVVGRRLAEHFDAKIVVVGDKNDRGNGEQLRKTLGPSCLDFTGRLTMRQSLALLRKCSLFVDNDSGPMHMASSVGLPIVEISCHPQSAQTNHHNSPERFGPWGVSSVILRPRHAPLGCENGCEEKTTHCINQINITDVLLASRKLLCQ